MVGKETNSHIFQHCYTKCCKLQNLNPLPQLNPTDCGKNLDFCVDRVKYTEWGPILNALSCDLSLHSIAIRCRQPVNNKNVDCDKLAKNVNKRAVILTRFMLSNLIDAVSLCMSSSTLLTSFLLEGFPLKEAYLTPIIKALESNSSLQQLSLPRCSIGDAGCLAVCRALRSLPNIYALDLSYCDISVHGAEYIADLIKHQKVHRYSENWVHTLRYRLPQLDAMAGLRRVTLCGNTGLGDAGAAVILEELSDDLWIKAIDLQKCNLTEVTAQEAFTMLTTNTTLVVLDLRYNSGICSTSLSHIKFKLKDREKCSSYPRQQFRWLSSSSGSGDTARTFNKRSATVIGKERMRSMSMNGNANPNTNTYFKKERDFAELLEEQLQEEIAHRKQLERLNLHLVDQMKMLKQQQIRIWNKEPVPSSGNYELQQLLHSELSASSRSYEAISPVPSEASTSVPIDVSTLSYVQSALKDIYNYIRTNQCNATCERKPNRLTVKKGDIISPKKTPKKVQSLHHKIASGKRVSKSTKSASQINSRLDSADDKLESKMLEKTVGDTKVDQVDSQEIIPIAIAKSKRNPKKGKNKLKSDSSDTLVTTPRLRLVNDHDDTSNCSSTDDGY